MSKEENNASYFSEDQINKITEYVKKLDLKLKSGFVEKQGSFVRSIIDVFESEAERNKPDHTLTNAQSKMYLEGLSKHLGALLKDLKNSETKLLRNSIDERVPTVFINELIGGYELKNTIQAGDPDQFSEKVFSSVNKRLILKNAYGTKSLIDYLKIYQEAVKDISNELPSKTGKRNRQDIKSLDTKIKRLALIYKKAGGKLSKSPTSEVAKFIQFMLDVEAKHNSSNPDKIRSYEAAIERVLDKIKGG